MPAGGRIHPGGARSLISFRLNAQAAAASAPAAAPGAAAAAPSAAAAAAMPASSPDAIDPLELPARYGRLQMSEEEMELVEMGGAA